MPNYPSNSPMRSGLEAQVNFMTELTRRTYESMRRLSEINLHFAQQVVQDTTEAGRKLLSCADPFQMAAASASIAQPAAQHLRSYQQQILGLMTGTQLELTRAAESTVQQASGSAYLVAQQAARQTAQASDSISTAFRPEDSTATTEGSSESATHHTTH